MTAHCVDMPVHAHFKAAMDDLATKSFKSPGEDGCTNWMLLWGGMHMQALLWAMFKALWATQTVPVAWKHAVVHYLYKNKGQVKEVSNYRPIALTSVMARLYCKAVILPKLEGILAPQLSVTQGCGKKGMGCREHLWAFYSLVEDCTSKGGDVHAFFADIHKAYDQVWREGLYYGLYAMGVRGPLYDFVRVWVGGATATPVWNGTKGDLVQLEQCRLVDESFCG